MKKLIGMHALWSKPYFYNNDKKEYFMPKYAIYTLILSALKWRENNGDMILYIDDIAYDYLKKYDIDKIYSEIKVLRVDKDIKENIFWAAGKLHACYKEQEPVVLIDTDMIVWKNISHIKECDVVAMHTEEILKQVYPDNTYFNMKEGYEFDKDFDYRVLPVNTAILYIKDMEFKNYYLEKSFDFMLNTGNTTDTLKYMVFAEQRLLSMCAKQREKNIKCMIEFPHAIGAQDTFTHLWGYKQILNENKEIKNRFEQRLKHRLLTDFQNYKDIIKLI